MKPSEAYAAGLCPSCLGKGRVHKFVPHEHVGPCSSCGGEGTLQGMLNHLDATNSEQVYERHDHIASD